MKKRTICLVGFILALALSAAGCAEKADISPRSNAPMTEIKEQGEEKPAGMKIDVIKMEENQVPLSTYSDQEASGDLDFSKFTDQVRAFGGYLLFRDGYDSLVTLDFDEARTANHSLSLEQLAAMEDYWTIACFGVNSADMNLGEGSQCDTTMICSVNKKTGEIRLVSIFPDTYFNVGEKDAYDKISAAYHSGGPTEAVEAINKNLGLNISDYVTFNWKAVADAINILDGIDVMLSDSEFYYMNAFITETVAEMGVSSTHLKHAGMNRLDGVQAVAYGRLRLMDTDYASTERQRIVIQKAFDKAGTADLTRLSYLMKTALPQMATSVEVVTMLPVAQNISEFYLGEATNFPTARMEVKKLGSVTDIVVPMTLENNVAALHQFLFGEEAYAAPPYLKEISSHIEEAGSRSQEENAAGQ